MSSFVEQMDRYVAGLVSDAQVKGLLNLIRREIVIHVKHIRRGEFFLIHQNLDLVHAFFNGIYSPLFAIGPPQKIFVLVLI